MSSASGVPDAVRLPVGSGGGEPVDLVELPAVESFERFYVREYGRLVALAYALTGSRAHAEDTAQEAMLATYRRWDEVSRLDWPAGWAHRVCANLATSFVRRRVVEARAMLRPTELAELEAEDGAFWAEVRRLPTRQAQCVALTYVYGYSVAEVAATLGCADGSVKAHLSRGRSRLARRLGESDDGGQR